jgi:hypothetical protein
MQSPNDTGSHGIRLATNDSLSYPDVTRWRDQREVEEALIRKITDIYSIPEEYAEPRGVGVIKALEVLRTEHRTPQPLVLERRSATPAARPKAASRRRGFSTGGMFFGMWLGGFAAAMSIIGLTHLGRSRAIVDMSYVLFASLVVLGGVVCGRVFAD